MSKFTFMQPVAVSDTSDNCAISRLDSDVYDYYYLFTSIEGSHFIRWVGKSDGEEGASSYIYAVAIPEKKKIPYTFETFPKCYTLLRYTSEESSVSVVVQVNKTGLQTVSRDISYSDLQENLELSFDSGKTWVPFWLEG